MKRTGGYREPLTDGQAIRIGLLTNPCLLHALENGIDYGIWGGLSADERNRLRRAPAPGWEASA